MPSERTPVPVQDKEVPAAPDKGAAADNAPFLADDPLAPLPVIDLEPLPILDAEPLEDGEEPVAAHTPHMLLGLLVDVRI